MADNTTINTGSGGDTIATDDLSSLNGGAVSGVKAQRMKAGYGPDGVLYDVSATGAGLPVGASYGTLLSAAITATGNQTWLSTDSLSYVYNQATLMVSGTYAGLTFVVESSPDGTNYVAVPITNITTGVVTTTTTPGTNATAIYDVPLKLSSAARVRVTAFTSGTANMIAVGVGPGTEPSVIARSQGLAAAGSAVVGNPVLVAGSDGANARSLLTTSAGHLFANVADWGGTAVTAGAAAADGTANPTVGLVGATNLLFNGTTWDRQRGNQNTTTGDTGAKTTSFNGATQTNYNFRGAYITVLCGTVSGTSPTMTAQLQFNPDGAGTTWLAIGPASGTVTATGNSIVFLVGPNNWSQTAGATPANLTTGGTQTVAINAELPRTWRLAYTLGGTPSFAITAVYVNYFV